VTQDEEEHVAVPARPAIPEPRRVEHAGSTARAPDPLRGPSTVAVTADLDVPGETRRQTLVFVVWFVCLLLAVIGGSLVGAHVPLAREGTSWADEELAASRLRKAKIAVVIGLLLPACLTFIIRGRYRRGGGHARGIVVDVTDGELRIWGRGYGARVRLAGADVSERLVDVYAGRLGAWRQRRLRVRAASGGRAGFSGEIEVATLALASDEGFRVEGGEGDCVELSREDFLAVRDEVFASRQRI
jgi:hypothetical protein